MEVKIAFDTEKESVQELKKMVTWFTELISRRETTSNNKIQSNPVTMSTPQINTPQKPEIPAGGKTAGGGKILEYQDLTDTMSKIYGGR